MKMGRSINDSITYASDIIDQYKKKQNVSRRFVYLLNRYVGESIGYLHLVSIYDNINIEMENNIRALLKTLECIIYNAEVIAEKDYMIDESVHIRKIEKSIQDARDIYENIKIHLI